MTLTSTSIIGWMVSSLVQGSQGACVTYQLKKIEIHFFLSNLVFLYPSS